MKNLNYKIEHSKNFPFELHLDITNHCNMTCDICPMADRYTEKIFPLGYMDFELFKDILNQCYLYHPEGYEINLHKDGEPLLHPELAKMIKYAKSKGAFVHFATNGLLLPLKKKEILDAEPDLITISLLYLRQIPSLAAFMENKNGQKPFTQAKFFNKLPHFNIPPVDKVICSNLHNFSSPSRKPRQAACPKLLYNPAITWDGKFCLCCVDYKRETVIGDVKKDSIKDLWKSVGDIYYQQSEGKFKSPCDKCNYWESLEEEYHAS